MNYLDRLRTRFPAALGPNSLSIAPGQVTTLGTSLAAFGERLGLSDSLGDSAPGPECLLQVADVCVAILRRRPELSSRVGISADELDLLRRKGIDTDMLIQLAAHLLQAVRDGQLQLTGRLAAQNSGIPAVFARYASDPAVPAPARHRLVACTRTLQLTEARRLKKRQRAEQDRSARTAAAHAANAGTAEVLEIRRLTRELLRP